MSSEIESRAVAAYLGLALGDALGATLEFMTPREIVAQYGVHRRIVGGGWLRLRAGAVTDDTTMSLALGEAILACGGQVDALSVAQAFDAWMRDKPVDIGNTVRRGVLHYRQTGQAVVVMDEQAAGNGACMRVLPVALALFGKEEAHVREACRIQAQVTHNNPLSDAGSFAVARLVQGALSGMGLAPLHAQVIRPLIEEQPVFAFRGRRVENPSGYIVDTLRAVFQALFDNDSFESSLVDVVNRGGDADTTGAIAGMVAGALYGLEGLPGNWLASLDREIRVRCTEQARALLRYSPQFQAVGPR
ncbi:MAG: ADP-ribosyl-[dinitrogen reductase] hydrolase [Halothiobacillaceae bacterium]|nr:ADP-ribosyl-[dinitrogen reductase] hydrolase [Halothiobacillaceae bacterium]